MTHVISEPDFAFVKRSRRPPEDALNAMLSFGNVFLYNYVAGLIHRSPLDIRYSFLHSAKRRSENLQLDIADIFKSVIVERTVFSLINRREIRADKHFEEVVVQGKRGVYLNRAGKLILLAALKNKLRSVVTVGQKKYRYSDLLRAEVYKLNSFFREGLAYKAYKYHN